MDLSPLGHGDWRGSDLLSLTLFLFLHYLRTNITMTYVSQFVWRILYTFDSCILFSTVLNIFPLWEVEGAYCPPLHKGLQDAWFFQTWPWDERAPQLSPLPPRPGGDQSEAQELERNQIWRGQSLGLADSFKTWNYNNNNNNNRHWAELDTDFTYS